MRRTLSQASIEKWRIIVNQCQDSGKTAVAWCRENKISYETFIMRRSQLNRLEKEQKHSQKAAFVELAPPTIEQSGVEIHVHGRVVAIKKNFDALTLLQCIQTLEGLPC